ncbi:MAG: PmoA family protein [Flavisolibacter sp.]|nr:PmoA family protein [Flavisolibacter sp.]MBD0295315.1 PmoA family protein [Flavisolibacter sp.]
MKTKHFLVFILFASLFRAGHAQKIATLEVVLAKPTSSLSVPAKTDLDAITFLPDSVLNLVEVNGSKRTPVPYQIQNTDHRTLYWTVDPGKEKHTYELVKGSPSDAVNTVHAKMENGALLMESGNKKLLNYYYKTVYPPAGIDTSYRRSGFIHPLWTPHGQELTRIQPPDHYHHYGIWNPWTHVYFEKDTVDFWNIGDKKGTVRFAKFVSVTDGPVFSEFEALHEHVVFKKDGSEKVALNELQTVRVYQPQDNADYFIVDITSKMNCASESPFLIVAYRYAGMGWRTTEFWNNTNCEVLTSEGKTRKNTDGSKARWCIVQGALPGNDSGGVAFLSYPANYNYPEPMRIWGENTNGRGDMFFNFAPTKDKDWLLEPGKTYTLKYRMVVFNGKMDAARAESAWQYFATPPKVNLIPGPSPKEKGAKQ